MLMRVIAAITSSQVPAGVRIILLMAFVCMMTTGCVYTAPFTDADGRLIPHSIATMERLALGGLTQSVWFRGVSDSNPALILLHGGPGASEVALYVGGAQIANMPLGRRLAYDFTFSEALKRGNSEARKALQHIGPPPYASVDELLAVEEWTQRFGGVNHARISTGTLIWAALGTDEANLIDLIKFGQGNRFSLSHLEGELSRLDLTERYRSFAVPIVFLLGRYDRHIPSELAEQYFNMIEAPCKLLLWFDQSGHNPPFEEPERFNAIMIKDVLPLATDGCAQ